MPTGSRFPWPGHAVAAAAVGCAFVGRLALAPWAGPGGPLLFLLAVLAAAYAGGRGPGLFATALGALAAGYVMSLDAAAGAADLLHMLLFVGCGVAASLLGESLHRARRAAAAHDRLSADRQADTEKEVSRRRAAEAALRDTQALTEAVFQQLPVGVLVADAATGTLRAANREARVVVRHPLAPGEPAARALTGVRGFRPDGSEYAPDDWPLPRALAGESVRGEPIDLIRPDGSRVTVSANAGPVRDAAGGVTAAVVTLLDVTAARRAERELAESERRFREFAENTQDVLWIADARDRRLVYLSPGFERVWGRPAAPPPADLSRLLDAVHPADRPRVRRGWDLAAAGPFAQEYRVVRPDGETVWVHDRGFPVRDAAGAPVFVAGIAADVTARKRAEDAVRASEERFRLAAEAVDGIIYDYDPAADTVVRTRGLYEVAGYDPDEVPAAGGWWLSLVHPDDRAAAAAAFEAARVDGADRCQVEYRVRHQDGSYRHMVDRAILFRDTAGRLVRLIGCSVDVTARREAEEALVRSEGRLQEADRHKDAFLAMLAHELRNPLAPIRTAVAILGRVPGVTPAVAQVRDMIGRQVTHLTRLVDDLLDVSRISRGKIQIHRTAVDLRAVVEHAVETSRPLIEARRHRLEVSLPPGRLPLEGDPDRLAQVVANLLNNAAKYTPEGGAISVIADIESPVGDRNPADGTAGANPASQSSISNPKSAIVRVKDSGEGIAADQVDRLFEPFAQVPGAEGRSMGGLGLGLALVKSLVELHGGTVTVHSDGPGAGSEFVVTLPVGSPDARPAADANGAPRGAADGGRRVLVVDDNADACESLALLLRMLGHTVETAADGPAGLRAAAAFGPELILLDIGMPGMSGLEVAAAVRRDDRLRGCVLAALTGWGQDEDRRKTRDAGFDHHLVKPVDPGELQRVLESVERHAAKSEARP